MLVECSEACRFPKRLRAEGVGEHHACELDVQFFGDVGIEEFFPWFVRSGGFLEFGDQFFDFRGGCVGAFFVGDVFDGGKELFG